MSALEPPVGAVVQDFDGDIWKRHTDGRWRLLNANGTTFSCTWEDLLRLNQPLDRLVPAVQVGEDLRQLGLDWLGDVLEDKYQPA